jgi:L-seryl-tRNA(Ser) seleniumtransferase
MSRIPDTTGMKNEVLIQRPERWLFERTVTQTGAELRKVGDVMRCTPEQIEGAIGPATAAIVWVASSRARPGAEIVPLERVVDIGRRHSVPVIVDAAGQSYPLSKFRQYASSADLVCFGSKYIGGPNSVGYVCGDKDLIKAVDLQGFISFDELGQKGLHGGIGRAFKIDRSEVVAAVVSLQEWFEMDHEARLKESERQLMVVEDELRDVPHVEVSWAGGHDSGMVSLVVTPDASAIGKSAREVAIELAEGDPPVWVGWGHRFPERLSVVASWGTLMAGQERVLAKRLRAALTGPAMPSSGAASGHHPAMNVPETPPQRI